MKAVVLSLIFICLNSHADECKSTPKEREAAIKAKLTKEWKTLPRFTMPKFNALPFSLSEVSKDESTGNYRAIINRGQTICKELIYQASIKPDCSVDASLISLQGCRDQ